MGTVKPVYKIFQPERNDSFEVQWNDCFNWLLSLLLTPLKPFRINIFVHSSDTNELKHRSDYIGRCFSQNDDTRILPFTIIPQSPAAPAELMIEAGFVSEDEVAIEYLSASGMKYTAIKTAQGTELWVAGKPCSPVRDNFIDAAVHTFDSLQQVLSHAKFSFSSIVRQWNYIGNILKCTERDDSLVQNYQMFNDVRNKYYSQYRSCKYYPAATGIGMDYEGVKIDCFAISHDSKTEIYPVKSPTQKDSYQYRQEVLVGEAALNQKKHAPQFERGLLLKSAGTSRLIISGTASINGEETTHTSVEQQTLNTIVNIEALASSSNLKLHCPNLEIFPEKYAYLRVYVKNRNDISQVKEICARYFGEIPISYVQADICRNNLLVEIEGEKISD
jgi:enamine deaminase RidA (YjgF/YER057c/UK114 family)